MRDLDRWKDKVELQLDGRQIFLLFFGSALCACLIFVLGVVVGKRVEARAVAQLQSPAEDPLAALDELGNAEEALTFHSALAAAPPQERRKAPAKEQAKEPKAEDTRDADDEGKGEAAPAEKKPVAAKEPEKKPAPAEKPDRPDKPEKKVVAAEKPDKPEKKVVAAKDADKKPADPPRVKGHYTLQISSFANKGEATDLLKKLREAGYKPFLVESQVPGKGLMFRVRLGDFASHENALTAKGDFERKQKMVAYVAKL